MNQEDVKSYIEDNASFFEYFIIRATEDQNQNVRKMAKQCIILYRKISPLKCALLINFGLQSAILKKEIKDELSLSEEDDMFGLVSIVDLSDRQMFCADAISTMNKMRELFDRARTPQ